MVGPVWWHALGKVDRGEIDRAILHPDGTLVIGLHTSAHNYAYGVTLKRVAGDRFEGTTTHRQSSVPWPVTATLYQSTEAYMLHGEWSEGSTKYQWWAVLRVVDAFPDAK